MLLSVGPEREKREILSGKGKTAWGRHAVEIGHLKRTMNHESIHSIGNEQLGHSSQSTHIAYRMSLP